MRKLSFRDRLLGCFYGGAIGDCMGSIFENRAVFGKTLLDKPWQITDDTQLTMATIESIASEGKAAPEKIAKTFAEWYGKRKFSGLGSSTLKALQELQVGGHWALCGRQGEYAAGNGAAMRVAPLAFIDADRQLIRDICRITHRNDEAYTGGLVIIESIRAALLNKWVIDKPLIPVIIDLLPDTNVRDRMIELNDEGTTIAAVAKKYGNSGYVAHSVPLAIYAAQQVGQLGFEEVLMQLIYAGGDTDTKCSLAGQLMGALIGYENIPAPLIQRLHSIPEISLLKDLLAKFESVISKEAL